MIACNLTLSQLQPQRLPRRMESRRHQRWHTENLVGAKQDEDSHRQPGDDQDLPGHFPASPGGPEPPPAHHVQQPNPPRASREHRENHTGQCDRASQPLPYPAWDSKIRMGPPPASVVSPAPDPRPLRHKPVSKFMRSAFSTTRPRRSSNTCNVSIALGTSGTTSSCRNSKHCSGS